MDVPAEQWQRPQCASSFPDGSDYRNTLHDSPSSAVVENSNEDAKWRTNKGHGMGL